MNKQDGWKNYIRTENLNGTFSLIELEALEKAYCAGWQGSTSSRMESLPDAVANPYKGFYFMESSVTAPDITAEDIYNAYPRKVGKQAALKAIKSAIKRDHGRYDDRSAEEYLLFRTQTYATAVAKWPKADKQYIPFPATWFNRGSYDDDPKEWDRQQPAPNGRVSASNIRYVE